MKRMPSRTSFKGRTITVHMPLSDLMRQPRGSSCLYLVHDLYKFEAATHTMAIRAGGRVLMEPLLGIHLPTEEIFNVMRVVVDKTAEQPGQYKVSHVNICAPPKVLASCKVGTVCIYENMGRRAITHPAKHRDGKLIIQRCYLIDIQRGTTKPCYWAEVEKPARLPQKLGKDYMPYTSFLHLTP